MQLGKKNHLSSELLCATLCVRHAFNVVAVLSKGKPAAYFFEPASVLGKSV